MEILALDLEHTLISSAITCFIRPGLNEFLHWALERYDKVVLYTSVPTDKVTAIQRKLLSMGEVDAVFASLECIDWSGKGPKDLKCVSPFWQQVVMVDDFPEGYALREQLMCWVKVPPFNGEESDKSLFELMAELDT